jgi:formylglycine-generating enzyme required for sulfatase activity
MDPAIVAAFGLALLLPDPAELPTRKRSMRAEAWWSGLGRPLESAPAWGVAVLRAPLASRVRVSGGRFVMGSTIGEMNHAMELCKREMYGQLCDHRGADFRAEGNAHEVSIFTFDIDRTEVTVEAYGRCVAAGACAPSGTPQGDARFDRPNLPVTFVRWNDAVAYCAWAGGRLPTEAEWEFAARGPGGRIYPWGRIYNPRLCNHGAFASDETDATDGFAFLAPVGSLPDGATPTGILDMAGNAAEWVSDFFEVDPEGHGYDGRPAVNPKGPPTGAFHVVRGGSFASGAAWVRAAARSTLIDPRSARVGFRCAYDVEGAP